MTANAIVENGPPALVYSREAPGFQDDAVTAEDLAAINQLSAAPLRAEQVFVRSMYLCSTQPCDADGCQFTLAALQQIARLIVGQSVLPGHDRRSLPLARFFRAEVVERDGEMQPAHFVRAWFYWLRDTSGAKDLLLNIDGGIYREVSLAWKFNRWRCSICNAQNNQCSHRPGERYGEKICYRLIDSVSEVLEGSLVYKSADRSTNVTGARSAGDADATVFMVAQRGDPVFDYLNAQGLIDDAAPISDWDESLRGSVEAAWRRDAGERSHDLIERSLAEQGVVLHEQLAHASSIEGAVSASMRQGDGLRTIPSIGEAN
ncbi:MAG: hypothetical protein P9L94_11525 [Candidatus Hinthialibacter antarcticus]|nr:hypothetical protein [Candidatus Hinthialibacter antarcticus]